LGLSLAKKQDHQTKPYFPAKPDMTELVTRLIPDLKELDAAQPQIVVSTIANSEYSMLQKQHKDHQ